MTKDKKRASRSRAGEIREIPKQFALFFSHLRNAYVAASVVAKRCRLDPAGYCFNSSGHRGFHVLETGGRHSWDSRFSTLLGVSSGRVLCWNITMVGSMANIVSLGHAGKADRLSHDIP